MKEEAGITENSLDNASEMRIKHGWDIAKVNFVANVKDNDYFVTVYWMDGTIFEFTGFAWGYPGLGPDGLRHFLNLFNLDKLISVTDIPIDKFGKTDCTLFVKQ